jgi:hypothetical protein
MPYQNCRAGAPVKVKCLVLERRTCRSADHAHEHANAIVGLGVYDCQTAGAQAREQAGV